MTSPDLAVDPAGAPAGPDGAHPAASPGRRRLLLALSLLGLLLAVALAVLAVLLVRADAVEDRREAIERAATQTALNLTSIDVEDYDEDIARVLDGATGTFRADLESRQEELEQSLRDNEVASEGDVIETAVLREDDETATALVVVDGTVRNTAAPEGRVNSYRMRLELELVDGQWKTSMLDFVA